MDYESMLDDARKELPEDAIEAGRFSIPKAKGHLQGNRTVISNFYQIAQGVNRSPEMLMKHMLKEMATPGNLSRTALIMGTKVSATKFNQKVEQFVKQFVLCSECQKPDTKMETEHGILYLKCSACGAKHAVKAKL